MQGHRTNPIQESHHREEHAGAFAAGEYTLFETSVQPPV